MTQENLPTKQQVLDEISQTLNRLRDEANKNPDCGAAALISKLETQLQIIAQNQYIPDLSEALHQAAEVVAFAVFREDLLDEFAARVGEFIEAHQGGAFGFVCAAVTKSTQTLGLEGSPEMLTAMFQTFSRMTTKVIFSRVAQA